MSTLAALDIEKFIKLVKIHIKSSAPDKFKEMLIRK